LTGPGLKPPLQLWALFVGLKPHANPKGESDLKDENDLKGESDPKGES
jgi:hypothetical protein